MVVGNPDPIVVAVGHEPVIAALDFATAHAARLGCGVHLVHAVPGHGPGLLGHSPAEHERHGRLVLGEALEHVLTAPGNPVPVSSGVVEGNTVSAVVSAASDAQMIVVEHRHRGRLRRVATRSVAAGAAARARIPVVAVPTGWSAGWDRAHPDVTVGIDRADRSRRILGVAAREARLRGTDLRVIHAWHLGAAEATLPLATAVQADWAAEVRSEIEGELRGLDGNGGGVGAEIVVRHAPPAEALLDATRESALLVVGRHDAVLPVGSHLGPVVRAVLMDAHCPVLLADTHA